MTRRRRYKARIWRGESGKGWCYEIINPEGDVIVAGARLERRKRDVESYLARPLSRMNATLSKGTGSYISIPLNGNKP